MMKLMKSSYDVWFKRIKIKIVKCWYLNIVVKQLEQQQQQENKHLYLLHPGNKTAEENQEW